jgi:hypothetical protein
LPAHDETDTATSYFAAMRVSMSSQRSWSGFAFPASTCGRILSRRAKSRGGLADHAEQQSGREKEQGGECGRQVRNGIHFIGPGGNWFTRLSRASGSSLAAADAAGNRVDRQPASKRDFFPHVAKSLILHREGPPPRHDGAAEGPATRMGSPRHFFFALELASRSLVAHSSQHTSTGLPPIFTVMVDLGSSG